MLIVIIALAGLFYLIAPLFVLGTMKIKQHPTLHSAYVAALLAMIRAK